MYLLLVVWVGGASRTLPTAFVRLQCEGRDSNPHSLSGKRF